MKFLLALIISFSSFAFETKVIVRGTNDKLVPQMVR